MDFSSGWLPFNVLVEIEVHLHTACCPTTQYLCCGCFHVPSIPLALNNNWGPAFGLKEPIMAMWKVELSKNKIAWNPSSENRPHPQWPLAEIAFLLAHFSRATAKANLYQIWFYWPQFNTVEEISTRGGIRFQIFQSLSHLGIQINDVLGPLLWWFHVLVVCFGVFSLFSAYMLRHLFRYCIQCWFWQVLQLYTFFYIYTLCCQKQSLICFHIHMNLSGIPFLIHKV